MNWKNKPFAFLHDPPSKPFNVAEYREAADTLIRNAGFDPAEASCFFDKVCDQQGGCGRSSDLPAGSRHEISLANATGLTYERR